MKRYSTRSSNGTSRFVAFVTTTSRLCNRPSTRATSSASPAGIDAGSPSTAYPGPDFAKRKTCSPTLSSSLTSAECPPAEM